MAATGLTTYPLKNGGCLTPGCVLIPGTFLANGVSNPIVLIGLGFTVAYSGVGKYTVTFSKTYHRAVSIVCTTGESTSTGLFKSNIEEIDRTTTCSSFVVHLQSTVTDTDTTLQQINFIAIMADTTIANERAA